MLKYCVFSFLFLSCLLSIQAGDIVLLNSSREGVELKWSLTSYQIQEVGEYSFIEFSGGSGLASVGKPSIPSQQTFIEIPMDAVPQLRVSDIVVETAFVQKPIAPAQEPEIDTVGAEQILQRNFYRDAVCYASEELFPKQVVEIAYDGIMRGRRLLLVRFNPIQYSPKTGKIVVHKDLTVKIDCAGSLRSLGDTDDAMDGIAQALVLNYEKASRKANDSTNYLILTLAELEQKAQEFAQWKSEMGYRVQIEIVGNNPSVATIKDLIRKYYPGVKYVVILGDHTLIALPQSARHPLGDERCRMLGIDDAGVPSDLYYATLEGNDYYPDVYVGRIPAKNVEEATLLIDKLLLYQKNPPTGEWLKRFLLCGEFQYQSAKTNMAERLFCETAYTIWNSLKSYYIFPTETIGTGSSGLGHSTYFFRKSANPNDPTKPGTYRSKIRDNEEPIIDCQMPAEWAKNIKSDAEAKANTIRFWQDGACIVQHRDHGGETGWGKPSLGKNDVLNLKNGDKLPILFSVNCLTGAMDYSSDCFVESALKNPQGGAAAALGSTRVSYSWWNDRLCDGFYTCLYGTGIYDCMDTGVTIPTEHAFSKELGVVLNFGKMYLAKNYPSNPFGPSTDYTEIEFYLFHCIGDPSMQIWTGPLTPITANIQQGKGLQIQVLDKVKRSPISKAQVCFWSHDQQIVLETDAKGLATFPQALRGTFILTITGDNLYPFQRESSFSK